MELHSYGMLLPCGIDKFHGTEYVCCPSSRPGNSTPAPQEDDEDEEIEDEEIDEADLAEDEETRYPFEEDKHRHPRRWISSIP